MSFLRTHGSWLALVAAGVGAASLSVSLLAERTAVDAALPWIVAVAGVCAWMARGTQWAVIGSLSVALFTAAPLIAPGLNERVALYGIAFAAGVMSAIAPRAHAELERAEGIVFLLLIALPFRLIGADLRSAAIALFMIAGCATLIGLRTSWSVFLLAAAVAIATPVEPARVAIFPWILASFAAPLPARLRPLVTLPLALIGGRWAWPLVLVAIVLALLEWRASEVRGEHEGIIAAPFYLKPLAWTAILRPALFFGELFARADRGAAIGLAVVCAGAFLRPPVAVLYALAGAAIAAFTSMRPTLPPAAAAVGTAALALLPWSGALVAAFPLPVETLVIAAAAASGALVAFRAVPLLRVVTGLALVAIVVSLRSGAEGEWTPAAAVLEPGQSATFALAHRAREVELAMSGGNVASLPRLTELGTVDLIDTRGAAYRRTVRAGEISDWSALSRNEHWRNHNGLPALPMGPIEGLGATAFLNGAGIVRAETPVEVGVIRVTASPALPPSSRLHLDALRLMR